MWIIYYSEPRDVEKNTLQIAQLTSVLANVNGNKTTMKDFIFNFSDTKEEKISIEERIENAKRRLRDDIERL